MSRPQELLQREIYSQIAKPLRGGPWRQTSMVMLADAFAADSEAGVAPASTRAERSWLERLRALRPSRSTSVISASSVAITAEQSEAPSDSKIIHQSASAGQLEDTTQTNASFHQQSLGEDSEMGTAQIAVEMTAEVNKRAIERARRGNAVERRAAKREDGDVSI